MQSASIYNSFASLNEWNRLRGRAGRNGFVGVLLVEVADLLVARRGAALFSSSSASSMVIDGEGVLFECLKKLRLMKGSGLEDPTTAVDLRLANGCGSPGFH